MRKPLLLLPAVLVFGYGLMSIAAPTPQAGSAAGKAGAEKAAADTNAHAKKLYEMDCAICHGAKGDGKNDMSITVEDWTSSATLSSKSDQDLFDTIRKGKDKMPPEDPSRAKNDEVKALITYIRSLSKAAPAATPAVAAAPTSPNAN